MLKSTKIFDECVWHIVLSMPWTIIAVLKGKSIGNWNLNNLPTEVAGECKLFIIAKK